MSEGSEETKRKLDSSSAGESSDVDNNDNCSSNSSTGSGTCFDETKRTCVDCGTIRTPLWRGGPAGPKSLCNACGIKSRKKRQAALVMKPEEKKKNRKSNSNDSTSSELSLDHHHHRNTKKIYKDACNGKSSSSGSSSRKGVSRVLELGFKVPVMKRSAVEKKRLWRELGEEERAALLLMALSCGSVYA